MNKDLDYYLNLPWQFEFTKHPNGEYSARVVGLSCYSGGKTMEEASREIQDALAFYLESCIESKMSIPNPIDIEKANGRLSIRTTKDMHFKLIYRAQKENVSVSHLVNDAITSYFSLNPEIL